MKPRDKKDQQLQKEFNEAHLYAMTDREARQNRKFWKKKRSKYLRQQGKVDGNDEFFNC